jgi:hypothetical protein
MALDAQHADTVHEDECFLMWHDVFVRVIIACLISRA